MEPANERCLRIASVQLKGASPACGGWVEHGSHGNSREKRIAEEGRVTSVRETDVPWDRGTGGGGGRGGEVG